jgi:putative membrane protein
MTVQRTVLTLVAATALALPLAAGAQQPSTTSPAAPSRDAKGGLAQADRKFIMDAARGNMAEVELGKLAAERGSSDAVKQFGQRMADDHGKAQDELKGLAQNKGVTMPADLDPKHKQLRDRLSKLSGADFDKAYINEMVRDHKKDVGGFKREAGRSKDAEVKAWAEKTLPTLEDHLKQVQQVQAQVKSAPRAAR